MESDKNEVLQLEQLPFLTVRQGRASHDALPGEEKRLFRTAVKYLLQCFLACNETRIIIKS
jgi:hypothetical protein